MLLDSYKVLSSGWIRTSAIMRCLSLSSNIGPPKYIKQILTDIKGETDNNIIIVGDFNTPFTSTDRSSRRKTNNETLALNNTLVDIN